MGTDTGVPASPSGHSRAEPEEVSALRASVPNAWTIAGSWPHFEVEPTCGMAWSFLHTPNDAVINGVYTSKRAALASLIASLEDTRRELSGEIAKHKRALRSASAIEARRAATTGAVHESAVPNGQTPNLSPQGHSHD